MAVDHLVVRRAVGREAERRADAAARTRTCRRPRTRSDPSSRRPRDRSSPRWSRARRCRRRSRRRGCPAGRCPGVIAAGLDDRVDRDRVDRHAVPDVRQRVVAAERVGAAHAGGDALVDVRAAGTRTTGCADRAECRPWLHDSLSTSVCTCAVDDARRGVLRRRALAGVASGTGRRCRAPDPTSGRAACRVADRVVARSDTAGRGPLARTAVSVENTLQSLCVARRAGPQRPRSRAVGRDVGEELLDQCPRRSGTACPRRALERVEAAGAQKIVWTVTPPAITEPPW